MSASVGLQKIRVIARNKVTKQSSYHAAILASEARPESYMCVIPGLTRNLYFHLLHHSNPLQHEIVMLLIPLSLY